MKFCTNCLLPNTKPDLTFSDSGICSACTAFSDRAKIDWIARQDEFSDLLKQHKGKSDWDCIVPVSGGKDSTAQVVKIMELGLNPLCVNSRTCDLTPLGRANLENIRKLGADLVEYAPDLMVRRRLNRIGLETVGDISWPEHVGIFTIPVRAAVDFNVPMIVWGENSQNEYGGPAANQHNPILDRRWLEEFGGLLGLRLSDLVDDYGFSRRQLSFYCYPEDEALKKVGVTGLFLGHFFPWDGFTNQEIARQNGFSTYESLVEGSCVDYENLDNYQTGIHDYFKYLKFGFSRTSDISSLHVRRGRISRNDALKIVKELDGRYPKSYLGKRLEAILEEIDMNLKEFDIICNQFTNSRIFALDENDQLVRRPDGSPLLRYFDSPK